MVTLGSLNLLALRTSMIFKNYMSSSSTRASSHVDNSTALVDQLTGAATARWDSGRDN